MQGSDYLVAGLRDPAYALVLAASVVVAWLLSWPETWHRRHPQRVEQYRLRWWGRWVFPAPKSLRWKGIGETGIVVTVFWLMIWCSCFYVWGKAERIRDGGAGHAVRVAMVGNTAPLPGDARLLGTSSAFVFLWWPQERRAEAVPIESIGRLQALAGGARTKVQRSLPTPAQKR